MDDFDIKRFEKRFGNLMANAQPQQPQPQKKKKNFWLDQLSTVGGIAGGIAGSFVTPIAGTAAGAAGGSALGEAIEKFIDPDSTDWGNVAQEGALGAVFGAGPMKLAKGGAALAAGKGVQAASQAAQTPLRQVAGKALTGAADDLAIKNFRFTPTQLTNFKNKFGEDVGQVLRKYGIQNADDVGLKGIEPLQQQFDEAITGITGVTKESLKKSLTSRISRLSKAGPSDTKAMGKQLKQEADALLKGYGDVIDANELNMIRRQFDDLVNYTEKAANPARYNVNKRMADAIRETLQKADPTGSLKATGRELQKLRQLSENISKQGNLGRGSLPLGLTQLLGGGVGAGVAGGPAGAIGGALATSAVNSPTGRRAAMKGAEKLGGRLSQAGKVGQSPIGIAGRLGGVGALTSMAPEQPETLEDAIMQNQSLENSATSMMIPTTTNANMNAPMMDESYGMQEQMSSPYSRENLWYDIQRDPENAEAYVQHYAMLQEVFNPPAPEAPKPLNQAQQERADLITALDNTEALMSGGSINYGPIGSRIEGVKSIFNAADDETLAFKNTISGLRAAITKSRAGASLTPGELKMLAKYTPSETDSEQVVRSKLAQLRALYGYNKPTSGASSLEDAILQAQYQ